MESVTMGKVNPPDLTPCFAAFCACGGWVAVAVDVPEGNAINAKSVSEWIRAGFRIEKVTVQAVRDGLPMCRCEPPEEEEEE